MTKKELSARLIEMYALGFGKGEAAPIVILFGIKYASELQKYSIRDIVHGAGLSKSYETDVRKGMHLAKYVSIKRNK